MACLLVNISRCVCSCEQITQRISWFAQRKNSTTFNNGHIVFVTFASSTNEKCCSNSQLFVNIPSMAMVLRKFFYSVAHIRQFIISKLIKSHPIFGIHQNTHPELRIGLNSLISLQFASTTILMIEHGNSTTNKNDWCTHWRCSSSNKFMGDFQFRRSILCFYRYLVVAILVYQILFPHMQSCRLIRWNKNHSIIKRSQTNANA